MGYDFVGDCKDEKIFIIEIDPIIAACQGSAWNPISGSRFSSETICAESPIGRMAAAISGRYRALICCDRAL
jgi:hypothetical protein